MTRVKAAAPQALTEVGGDTASKSIKYESTACDLLVSDSMVTKDSEWDTVVVAGPISDKVLSKNRMLLLHLEQSGVLAPGVVTIASSGELHANLSAEPDPGMMSGLYPNMDPSPDIDQQIPSWLRDYLVKQLNVLGQGPPVACQALYDGLQWSQDGFGINVSVWITETQLSCAVVSLGHSLELLRDFVHCNNMVEDTYEMEVGNIIRTVQHLVGCEGNKPQRDIQLLVDIGSMGIAMKDAINEPLERMIISPYSHLVAKIEMVAKALRQDLGRMQQEEEDAMGDDCFWSSPDSRVNFY